MSTFALLEVVLGEVVIFSALNSRDVVPDPVLAQFICRVGRSRLTRRS
jgi:hypothetical protein